MQRHSLQRERAHCGVQRPSTAFTAPSHAARSAAAAAQRRAGAARASGGAAASAAAIESSRHRLPDGVNLEVLHLAPAAAATPKAHPPLVFVHGSYHAAWCWEVCARAGREGRGPRELRRRGAARRGRLPATCPAQPGIAMVAAPPGPPQRSHGRARPARRTRWMQQWTRPARGRPAGTPRQSGPLGSAATSRHLPPPPGALLAIL
jgi:hypothetical protein